MDEGGDSLMFTATPGIFVADTQALVTSASDFGPRTDATIQLAINALPSTGGIIYCDAGIWNFSTGLTITKSGVSLLAAGAGATIFQTTAGHETIAMLTIGDNINTIADVRIADIQFSSANQKTANAAIKLQKCLRTHVERIRTQNQFRSIHVYNSTATWIDDSDLRDTSENGIVYESTLSNGFDCYLNNVLADNPVVSNNGAGIAWLGGENFVIQNCDFEHYTNGFSVAPPANQQCRFGFFVNAEFDTSGDNGIKISSAGGDIVGLTFTNGWSGTSINYGVLIDGGSGGLTQGIRFVGHKSLHNGLAGFRIAGGLDIHVDNCDVIANSQTASGTRSGIEIASGMASGAFSIVGCRCTNGWQQGSTQSNGINFDAATYTNGLVADCMLAGNVNNGLALNGASGSGFKIKNNTGYNPVGVLGPPAVPATGVAYTNAYGVDCTVYISLAGATISAISIGGSSTGETTAGAYRVAAGQTITIAYTVATPTWTWFGD